MKLFYKVCLLLFLITPDVQMSFGQGSWPSPEAEQMYAHAREYMIRNDLPEAIAVFKQAILLEPEKILLYEGLGDALYRSGRYSEAAQILTPLLPNAGAQCYELLAACQAAGKDIKAAKETINKGLQRYPDSGILYHRSGLLYSAEKKQNEALIAWLEGIADDPLYALNYYEAARQYLASATVEWGILYAEIYLCMAHDSDGDQVLKDELLSGYKNFFTHIAGEQLPMYGQHELSPAPAGFIAAIRDVYVRLTPVVSDGVTKENLTMVRTRFLIDWWGECRDKYPFTLFTYHDMLIRSGYFDIYNEWLFGKAENGAEYYAWNQFHAGDMERFTAWKNGHNLIPAKEKYNREEMDILARKKK